MALQIWMPLNGNLDNYGLTNATITNSGATIDNNGKIGKCYKVGSSTKFIIASQSWMALNASNSVSIAIWIKFSGTAGYFVACNSFEIYFNASRIGWRLGNGSGHTISAQVAGTYTENVWYHLTCTWNANTKTLSTYINGVLGLSVVDTSTAAYNTINANLNFSYSDNFYINDLRIYNHCLSYKEVQEISKGLVIHYKLDLEEWGVSNINLVEDGWGGTNNWVSNTSSTVSTNVPSTPTGITNSYKSNTTKAFISIISNHSYTLSEYVKAISSSGTCYLAIIPYDIDQNQINYTNQADGFRASSLTTLAQDLKNGDTIVYLTDASGWSNPGTNANYVAIFGYRDSTGYTYPDLIYTKRVYQYGTTSDKSNLDIANNRVTLRSAYSGETIPAGTSVCLASAGSTYYYPATITAANAQDWVLLSKTFTPNSVNYLKAARYIKITLLSYSWNAGITLIDNSTSTIIWDCSGFLNNANIIGNLNNKTNSPRYNHCIYMNNTGTTNHIEANPIPVTDNIFSVSLWVKCAKSTNQVIFADPKICIGILNNLLTVTPSTSSPLFNLTNFITNEWNHIVCIRNNSTYSVYINGISETASSTTNYYAHSAAKLYLLNRSNNSTYAANANISDVRVYASVLSQEDVLELYNNPFNFDNQKSMFSLEYNNYYNNIIEEANYGIKIMQWIGGLHKFTQANCQCTLENGLYRIYRNPNLTYNSSDNSTKTMWGGLILNNANNIYNLNKGHTYILQFEVKGQSTNAASDVFWSNNAGWGSGGLLPSPSNVTLINPVIANFESDEWQTFIYKWTINDDIYKTCTTSYSSFVQGQTYLSYKEFKFGFTYANTGSLGTNIYIQNIRLYDITSNKNICFLKTGISESIDIIEEDINNMKILNTGMILDDKFIEK